MSSRLTDSKKKKKRHAQTKRPHFRHNQCWSRKGSLLLHWCIKKNSMDSGQFASSRARSDSTGPGEGSSLSSEDLGTSTGHFASSRVTAAAHALRHPPSSVPLVWAPAPWAPPSASWASWAPTPGTLLLQYAAAAHALRHRKSSVSFLWAPAAWATPSASWASPPAPPYR